MKKSTIKQLTTNHNKIKLFDEEDYETVSLAIMQGNIDTLNDEQKVVFDRTRAAYNIVCTTPSKKQAVKKLRALYPTISLMQAYNDVNYAIKIWNPKTRYDRDFLESLLINNLIENIMNPLSDENARAKNMRTLQRYLSSLPMEVVDPELMQKHNIYIQLNVNGDTINIPYDKKNLTNPENEKYTTVIENEITDAQAEEFMES